jgi:hypothetical protein
MSALQPISSGEAWDRFGRLPAAIAHPVHIAPLFDGGLDEETAGRLARHPRFAARVSRLLERRLALPVVEGTPDAADRALALASAERLEALSRQAGAVCWGRAVAREIRGERVAALKAAIGEDAYAAALAHRSEALTDDIRLAPEVGASPEALAAAITRDGRGCLAAWLFALSEAVALRVRLRFPAAFDEGELDEAVREAGPRILRMLAA